MQSMIQLSLRVSDILYYMTVATFIMQVVYYSMQRKAYVEHGHDWQGYAVRYLIAGTITLIFVMVSVPHSDKYK